MNLLIDNNDGLGPQDYTSSIDTDHLPKITRKLNAPATMITTLVSADPNFQPSGKRRSHHPPAQRRLYAFYRLYR